MINWIKYKIALGGWKFCLKIYKIMIEKGCKTPFQKVELFCTIRNKKIKNGKTINEFIEWMTECDDTDIKYLGALWQAYDAALLANIVSEKVEAE